MVVVELPVRQLGPTHTVVQSPPKQDVENDELWLLETVGLET